MSAAAKVLSIATGQEVGAKTATANTRKEKQAAARIAKRDAERQEILTRAAAVGKPVCEEEKLVIAQAARIRIEIKLEQLEMSKGRIEDFLGQHRGDEDHSSFAGEFAEAFSAYTYTCPIGVCGSKEGVKWVLPLERSVAKACKDSDAPKPKNHAAQWERAVELFQRPEDLQGLVVCEKCKPNVELALEKKDPNGHHGNHRVYHIDGFSRQLGKNRFSLLKSDLDEIETEILVLMDKLQEQNRKVEESQKKVDEVKAQSAAIEDFLDD